MHVGPFRKQYLKFITMQIYDHDSPEAINFKNSSIELEDWIEHLHYIEKEITKLLQFAEIENRDSEKFQEKLQRLLKKRKANAENLEELLKYQATLPKAAECEDVECDMFYVNEHIKYRQIYRNHLDNYRKAKEEFFEVLSQ